MVRSGHSSHFGQVWSDLVRSGYPDQGWSLWSRLVTLVRSGHPGQCWSLVINSCFTYIVDICSEELLCEHDGYTHPNHCDQCRCPAGWGGRLCELVDQIYSHLGKKAWWRNMIPGVCRRGGRCLWVIRRKNKRFRNLVVKGLWMIQCFKHRHRRLVIVVTSKILDANRQYLLHVSVKGSCRLENWIWKYRNTTEPKQNSNRIRTITKQLCHSLYRHKNISVIWNNLIYCYYMVLCRGLFDGHSVNSSVTCYNFWTFATVLFRNT